jgi:hypothetical protein
MSDHIPDVTKMIGDTPMTDEQINGKPCTRFAILAGDSLRDALVPSEFCRQLERELNAANDRIRLLIAERDTARRQADQNYKLREEFTELLGTDDVERGVAVVRGLNDRIKRLEEAGDAMETRLHLRKNISDQFVYKGDAESVENWNKAKEDKL